MKIGLVIYGSLDTLSGGYLYDRNLVAHLEAQGDRVEIFSLPWRNYPAHLLDNLHFRLPKGLDILIQDELNHPSLILANRKPHPYPVISLVHHLRTSEEHPAWLMPLYRYIEQHYLKSVGGFIFNSEATRSVVEGVLGGHKPNVVANPPTDRFKLQLTNQDIRERVADHGPFRLLFLGNIIPRKGLHTLLEALLISTSDYRLDVVGSLDTDIPYARRMKQIASSVGFRAQVIFHGPLVDDRLVDLLRSAHVLVLPSTYEGFGIVYLEGMSFGLPAIGTDTGGAAEIIEDKKTGFLIPPGDAASLSEKLEILANDRDLLFQMSLNALSRFQRQPAWSETANRIRNFLVSQVASFDGENNN